MNFSDEFQHKYIVGGVGEKLELNPHHGEDLKIKVYGLDNRQIGGAYAKSLIYGRFVDSSGLEVGERIPMLVKKTTVNNEVFGEEKYSMPVSVRYYERWKFLRDIGVPVVPNLVALGDNRVAMTNMISNGGAFFGKEKSHVLFNERNGNVRRSLTSEEELFLELDDDEISRKIEEVQIIMSKNNVGFPLDDPMEVFIYPSGDFQIVVLDLSGLVKGGVGGGNNLLNERKSLMLGFEIMKKNLLKISGRSER